MSDAVEAVAWDSEAREPGERFRIENDEQAVWAMRKLAAARRRMDEITAISEAEIDRIKDWAEHEARTPMRDMDYFEAILREYAIGQRAEGRKTISTPYGSVKSRAGQPKWSVEDAEAFLSWARRNNRSDLIRVREDADLAKMKATLENTGPSAVDPETGEVVPGVVVSDAETSFTVEVAK